ncbi:ABC-three component system protein [Sabulicella glaciei]|uniref:ABC-three component systems C-terminal domain-containing protein n=1 Tax=Sabulicella glaciei TaxID=2984948 RepID=A0ABT3NZT3_9PROT|nr:ABC-three component system protein [Roseococcus sp. MDT2-1-1]MCW8087671.1 hypothetical protein [Roseococcus sp. MDT2-1-1]
MDQDHKSEAHSAEGSALGFWFQAYFALLTLVTLTTDEAAIGIEQLDDVELKADGQTLLYQLKHSISAKPPPITIKSRSLWRTVKVWIDVLPQVTLAETTLHLIAVGDIPSDSPLRALTDPDTNRADLVAAMTAEAARVIEAREAAAKAKKTLPFPDRVDGCRAFLALSEPERLNLLRRTIIRPDSPTVGEIEQEIAGHFHFVLPEYRPAVAKRLIEWWDRQIVYSLCGERDRVITRAELQSQVMAVVADLEQGKLVAEFETVSHPEDYQPDGMLARQIELVKGKPYDLERAIREEWKARAQRARWLADNPAMASKISAYDAVLREHWSDRHAELVDECASLEDEGKCASGLKLLRWTHHEAPSTVRPIAEGWGAAYYVRGTYQVLAINLKVGWHPDYETLLGGGE